MSSNFIDPSILLQSKPVQVQSSLDAQTQAQNLRNLGTTNQLQQGELRQQDATLQGTQQANQQRQNDLDIQAAINKAIPQNIAPGKDGKIAINHDGVVQTLLQAGQGQAALNYQTHATAIQKGVTDLQEAQGKLNDQHVKAFGSSAGAVADAPDGAKPALYNMFVQSGIANGQIHPGEWPEQYTPDLDARLKAARTAGQTPQEQETIKNTQAATKVAQQRADVADAAEANREVHEAETERENRLRDDINDRRVSALEKNADTNSRRADTYATRVDDQAAAIDPATGKPMTAGQRAVQERADQRERDTGRKLMDTVHQQRTAIGGALSVANGDRYTDPKSGKPSTDVMNDAIRSTLTQQFQNVTNQGLRLQNRFGWKEIEDPTGGGAPEAAAPAAAAPAPAAAAPAAAAPAKPSYIKYATNGKTRLGLNAATHKWEPVQ
jgi:hypothetical protein